MIPCKQIKCILLPSCLNKTAIDCESLRTYFEAVIKITHHHNDPDYVSRAWNILHKHLPKLTWVQSEHMNKVKDITGGK